jgi:hypothetical protein
VTPLALGAIIAAAAAGAALLIVSLVTSLVWRLSAARLAGAPPRARAQTLAALRLAPTGVAAATAASVGIAFLRFEPPDARETLGVVLPTLAFVTIGVWTVRLAIAVRAWLKTTQTVRTFEASNLGTLHPWNPGTLEPWNLGTLEPWNLGTLEGRVVDTPFPLVAVVGIWRPRLLIARQVIETCDDAEIDVVMAHEAAHVAAGDNLMRFLFACAPFAGARVAGEIEQAWTHAAEERADDFARRDSRSSLALASALTKVARLAAEQQTALLQASAILSGSDIEERVRRLLESGAPQPTRANGTSFVVALAALAVLSAAAQRQIYDAAEYCVRYLP